MIIGNMVQLCIHSRGSWCKHKDYIPVKGHVESKLKAEGGVQIIE